MKRFVVFGLTMMLGLLFAGPAIADKAADVEALVSAGVAMAKEKGVAATLKAIGDPKGPFIKGDLYLFAGPLDKVTFSAHPYKAKETVGKDLSKLEDKAGNFLADDFVKIANGPGKGWTEYWWPKPGEEKPSLKRSYIMRVPGKNLWVGGGYYE